MKKKVFFKPKYAKIKTKIRPFQYEKMRLRNYKNGLGNIEKALPALKNQFVTSSNQDGRKVFSPKPDMIWILKKKMLAFSPTPPDT